MKYYTTHYEARNGLLVLVVREFITSNFEVHKHIYPSATESI
jgi:hypothetical protein